jgi:hypothetical protein
MLVFLKLASDFSRWCAHAAMQAPISVTHPPLLDSRIDSCESPHLSGTLRGLVASSKDGETFSTGFR